MKFKDLPYSRPDPDRIRTDYEAVNKAVSAAKSGEELVECVHRHEKILSRYRTSAALAAIRHSLNTSDAFYKSENDFFDEYAPLFDESVNAFYDALLRSPFRAGAEKICGRTLFQVIETERKCFSPKIIPLLQEENALESRYQDLIAGARILFDGKELNVPLLAPYKVSPDRATRKAALEAEGLFYCSIGAELDAIFAQMVSVRTKIAHSLGFSSFTDLGYLRMGRFSYGREEVGLFRRSVRENVTPAVCRLKKRQSAINGVPDMKMYDDLFLFPDGNARPLGGAADILSAGKKMYTSLSPECASFIDALYSGEMLDVEARAGKATGGYCESLPDYGTTFIFSNFNGTEDDVNVLTHEAGHAFADYMVRDFPFLETASPTMEGCETHSMSMEFFAWRYLKDFYGPGARKAAYSHLSDALAFLPYGCMVDEFQHMVYDSPSLTPKERHGVWEELENTYRPYLDRKGIPFYGEGRGWQRQLHVYMHPFYYVDYCLAQTAALSFWADSMKDYPAAFSRYMTFVKAGGSLGFPGLCKAAGIRSPFEEGALPAVLSAAEKWFSENDPVSFSSPEGIESAG